ncbi:unnamed protein product [Symbiodinium natans]|uniref:EF-hand domain-containing protein n=1 Tax=Symbiodinium natans TaxID=878477 RepID=A0A812TES2_9DINO|nr:unnamed protein product [Symbiodinium natans]
MPTLYKGARLIETPESQEIEVMIEHADRDGKGFVTAEDFYVLMADEARRMQQQTDVEPSEPQRKSNSQAVKRWKKALISDKVDNVVQEWKISSVEKQAEAGHHKQSRSSRGAGSTSEARGEHRNSRSLLNPAQGVSTSVSLTAGSKDTTRKRSPSHSSPSNSKEHTRARGSSLSIARDGKDLRARSSSRSRKE